MTDRPETTPDHADGTAMDLDPAYYPPPYEVRGYRSLPDFLRGSPFDRLVDAATDPAIAKTRAEAAEKEFEVVEVLCQNGSRWILPLVPRRDPAS